MADKSQSFRDVIVRQKTHALTPARYRTSEAFPKHELFALTSQFCRATSSIPANFVEGYRDRTKPDKFKHYNIALGSADECLCHLIPAHDLNYTYTTGLQTNLEEVYRLLQGYINGLERDDS
jgi:four helix bundle protein